VVGKEGAFYFRPFQNRLKWEKGCGLGGYSASDNSASRSVPLPIFFGSIVLRFHRVIERIIEEIPIVSLATNLNRICEFEKISKIPLGRMKR
jgi:hypothetical protein